MAFIFSLSIVCKENICVDVESYVRRYLKVEASFWLGQTSQILISLHVVPLEQLIKASIK